MLRLHATHVKDPRNITSLTLVEAIAFVDGRGSIYVLLSALAK